MMRQKPGLPLSKPAAVLEGQCFGRFSLYDETKAPSKPAAALGGQCSGSFSLYEPDLGLRKSKTCTHHLGNMNKTARLGWKVGWIAVNMN